MFKFIGVVTVILIGLFFVLSKLGKFIGIKIEHSAPESMPKLTPIPIPTKEQDGTLARLIVYVTESRKWQVAEDWRYEHEGTVFIVPKGFVFDGASIPRPFWALLSPIGLLLIPGLIHDFGYRYDYIWCQDDDAECGYVKKHEHAGQPFWDQLFYAVGHEVNGMKVIDGIAYIALKSFGCFAWNENRKQQHQVAEVFPTKENLALEESEKSEENPED